MAPMSFHGYAPPENWRPEGILLPREETHHLAHVRRLKPGDSITLFDGCGRLAQGEIRTLARQEAWITPLEIQTLPPERPEHILVQALPRNLRMDWLVQKAVELGAAEIRPVLTAHSLIRAEAKQAARKHTRWETIALNAAKQCRAAFLTRIAPIAPLEQALEIRRPGDAFFAGTTAPGSVSLPFHSALRKAAGAERWVLCVGPEGGFSPEERGLLEEAGVGLVSFGSRILRAETAALFGLSVMDFLRGSRE